MGFFRFAWRLPAALAGLVVAVLFVAAPRVAGAQTLTLSTVGISRTVPLRADIVQRFKVSRSDCLANDVITFPLIVGGYAGTSLEVWATQSTSDNCKEDTARTSASATCWRVYRGTPSSVTPTVSIRVQDIAARPPTTEGTNVGTDLSCESTNSAGQPVVLYFMFMAGAAQSGQFATWPTTIDLLGPSAPAIQGVGAGGKLLKVNWTQNTDPDVFGYRVLCESLGSPGGGFTVYDADTPLPEASSRTTCPDAGSGSGTDDDAGNADDGGDAGDASDEAGGGAVVDACIPGTGGGGSGGTAGCGTVLVEGKTLTLDEIAKYSCGSAGLSSTSALVTGLNNYERYAVALASYDLVENIGTLSSVQCGTPQPVNGFDEAYRSAGGSADDAGFCSVGLRSAAARDRLWPAAVFISALTLMRSRRRRRRPVHHTN
jgi:hypothetical protein